MVGFIREPAEEDRVADQPKLKSSTNDTEGYKFDFDHYSHELDAFSFTPAQPFLDFDAIKDWIDEMQDGDREEASRVETGSEVQVERCLDNPVDAYLVDFVQDMKDPQKPASAKVEYGGTNENVVDNGDKIGEVGPTLKSDGLNDCIEVELGNVGPAEICCDGDTGALRTSHGDGPSRVVLNGSHCPKFESLGCSIQEGLEKVSLDGAAVGSVATASDMKDTEVAHVSNEDDSDSSSESESETETSSSSSSSSSESDGDEEEDQPCKIMIDKTEQRVDLEEGEIMGSDVEKMVSWSDDGDNHDGHDDENNDDDQEPTEDFEIGDVDDDDDNVATGPIKSKNELVVLPPVPPVNITLQPCHQILPVGIVSSILGTQLIVEGSEKHNPLSEGSIVWITDKRLPLGLVDEIFGPVKTPYYIVRYNSESEVPAGIQTGTPVGFVPEFVDHVLNDKNLYQKGYDASGENDEEVFDEVEFSDDEKEAEFRRMKKMSKRGNNNNNDNHGPGNKRKNRRNLKNRDKIWTKDQPSAPQAQTVQPSRSSQQQPPSSFSQGSQSGFPSNGPTLAVGPSAPNTFPQQAQAQAQLPAGFMINGIWANGVPFQQQNMAFPTGFQMNGIPWSSMNPAPWQQQQQFVSQFPLTTSQQPFDLSQLVSGSSVSPLTQMNFAAGAGLLGPNFSSNQGPMIFPGPGAQLPLFPGMQPNGPQAGQNSNSQQAAGFSGNVGARPQFNRGFSGGAGRGRRPFHQRGGGGRFGGGRGHQQSK